jgi:hypothetical protein
MWHARERGESYTGFWWESPRDRVHLEDKAQMGGCDQNGPQADWLGGVDWIHLGHDRDRWRAVVNAVMNLRVMAPWSYLVPHSSSII